jgi:hypothetical protein
MATQWMTPVILESLRPVYHPLLRVESRFTTNGLFALVYFLLYDCRLLLRPEERPAEEVELPADSDRRDAARDAGRDAATFRVDRTAVFDLRRFRRFWYQRNNRRYSCELYRKPPGRDLAL